MASDDSLSVIGEDTSFEGTKVGGENRGREGIPDLCGAYQKRGIRHFLRSVSRYDALLFTLCEIYINLLVKY